MKIVDSALRLMALACLASATQAVAQDLSVEGSSTPGYYLPGMILDYRAGVSVTGPGTMAGARLTVDFPTECGSVEWKCVATAPSRCSIPAGAGALDIGVDVAPGGAILLETACRLADPLPADPDITYTARITPPAGTTDPVPGNNVSVNVVDTPVPGAYLQGTMTVDGDFHPTGRVTYTTVLTNIGTVAQQANGPEYRWITPAELEDVTYSVTDGDVSPIYAPGEIRWDVTIPPHATATLTVSGRIAPSARGTVSSQGRVFYDLLDSGTVNLGAGFTDDPMRPGLHDPTDFVIAAPPGDSSAIPASTPAGLLALGVALGLIALQRSRDRRRKAVRPSR